MSVSSPTLEMRCVTLFGNRLSADDIRFGPVSCRTWERRRVMTRGCSTSRRGGRTIGPRPGGVTSRRPSGAPALGFITKVGKYGYDI
eukprot:3925254-Pyramimonas_sp.AAC.2